METRASEKERRDGEKRERESWNQTIIETEKERTSTRGWKKGRSSRPRGWEEERAESGKEKDVTRGITWCIDRRAASTRAIPAANLPTYPKHLPLSLIRPTHFPPDHHSPLRPPSPFYPPSLRPSPLQQTNHPPPPALHPLPGHQPPAKPPSDIHRRVSSELIIKCIVVPARALQYVPSIHYFSPPTLPPPSRAISSPPPPPPPPSPPPPLHPSPISLACVSFTRADSRAAASSSGLGRCKRWRKGTVDKEVSVIEPRSRSNYTRSIVGEREDVADGGSWFQDWTVFGSRYEKNFTGWESWESWENSISLLVIQSIE